LFHETPTVQSVDAGCDEVPPCDSPAVADAPPLVLHAASSRARTPNIAAGLRMTMNGSFAQL
jgi:hypothetical protein